jgi:hypothetical protein
MAIAITSFLTAVAVGVAWRIGDLEWWFLAMAIAFFLFGVAVLFARPQAANR